MTILYPATIYINGLHHDNNFNQCFVWEDVKDKNEEVW
jgi:hypothetical protein